MSTNTRFITAVSFILGAVGFLLPLWPLSLLGIALLALSGRFIFAVGLGVLLDVAYGAPVGHFAWMLFPFSIGALLLCLVRYIAGNYVINKDPQDTLE